MTLVEQSTRKCFVPKGPVIGPMVIAGVCVPESAVPELKAMGAKDSKNMTAKQRERVYKDYPVE